MDAAIHAAMESRRLGDYAVGSVIARGGQLVAAAGNRTHVDRDATLHAELIVIREASRLLGRKDLRDCTLYSTHEPCSMCVSAAVWARIPQIVFGATQEDHRRYRDLHGNSHRKWRLIELPAQLIADRGDPPIKLVPGFMREACVALFHAD